MVVEKNGMNFQRKFASDYRVCGKCSQPLGQLLSNATVCPSCLLAETLELLSPEDHESLRTLAYTGHSPSLEAMNRALPQFEFRELLGRGGSGWVFLAEQLSLGRLVAIKLLRRRAADPDSSDQRFAHEAQTLAKLSHQHIVTVHDYGATDEHRYLVMEYIAGPTLREKLHGGPLQPTEAVFVANQICNAVEIAHQGGIVHRDLKPENILFESESDLANLKVADFGIAKFVEQSDTSVSLTATGTVVGTPFYMAPERHVIQGEATVQGDVFSIGVILYEMLTGRVPMGNIQPLSINRGISKRLSNAVLRALEADPARRFVSVAAFADELKLARLKPKVLSGKLGIFTGVVCLILVLSLIEIFRRPFLSSNTLSPNTQTSEISKAQLEERGEMPLQSDKPLPASERTIKTSPTPPEVSVTIADSAKGAKEQYEVEVRNLKVSSQRPFGTHLRFELRFQEPESTSDEKTTYYWVFESRSGQRIEQVVPDRGNRTEVIIDSDLRPRRHHGLIWPADLYVEERWGELFSGRRRVSEIVKIQQWDVNKPW